MTIAEEIERSTERPAIHARIAPLPSAFLHRVRTEGVDDLGQEVRRLRAQGGEPCRDVLRRARPGEELILASFSPFTKEGPYREFGPVFVLAEHSDEPVNRDRIVIGGETDYLRSMFTIRAYSRDEEILDAALTDASTAQAIIDRFLDREDTAFLHVRFPTYGCLACRLDRE